MNLLYDHQIFDLQQYGGISRYFCELMREFATTGEPRFRLSCPYTTNSYLWESSLLRLNTPLTRRRYKGSGAVNNLLASFRNRPASVAALRQGEFDLFHPTYYDPYFLDHLGDKPFVLTVHDMIHERYPDCYPVGDPTSEWKRLLAERASHLIAVSQSTKDDLVKFYGVTADKVTVVHHGCSLPLSAPVKSAVRLPDDYLLYVGERNRYKNFAFAIQALAPLFRGDLNLWLVCVGGGAFTEEECSLFAELGIMNRCLQAGLSDQGLGNAYSNALALVFPSRCEGFGMPVLEAFACGCPALLARCSSLPEVGGDAALYFEPDNGEEILAQTARLLSNQSLRQHLIVAGRERVLHFTWERTAQETRAVYLRVMAEAAE